MRRVCASVPAVAAAAGLARAYRIIPHVDTEIEELAETQKAGRWKAANNGNYQNPLTNGEKMCDALNFREARRRGVLPEKSIARTVSQQTTDEPGQAYFSDKQVKMIEFTVVDMFGHPFHFRLPPMPDVSLNRLIDGSGMMIGVANHWLPCRNVDCKDPLHGDACMMNVDFETLDKLKPPNRFEFQQLQNGRQHHRADILVNTRFSCQIKITEEIDGGLFAMKNLMSQSFRAEVTEWSEMDNLATMGYLGCKKIMPYAPYLEEPTVQDFPITLDMLWENDWQEIMKHKYPKWKRRDGYHTKPAMWSTYL